MCRYRTLIVIVSPLIEFNPHLQRRLTLDCICNVKKGKIKKKQEGRSERIENRYEQKVNKNGKVGKVNDALVSNELCLFFLS